LLSTSNGNADDATSTNTGSSDDANRRFALRSGGYLVEASRSREWPESPELPRVEARQMQRRKEAWSFKSSRLVLPPTKAVPSS